MVYDPKIPTVILNIVFKCVSLDSRSPAAEYLQLFTSVEDIANHNGVADVAVYFFSRDAVLTSSFLTLA